MRLLTPPAGISFNTKRLYRSDAYGVGPVIIRAFEQADGLNTGQPATGRTPTASDRHVTNPPKKVEADCD